MSKGGFLAAGGYTECNNCAGSGERKCAACNGKGKVQ